jgi:hypothetical protein
VWNVVELGYDAVPLIRTCKPVGFVHLRAKVTENEDGGLVWTKEEGAYEEFKVVHHSLIAA